MAVAYRSSSQAESPGPYDAVDVTPAEPSGAASGDHILVFAWSSEEGTGEQVTMSSDWERIAFGQVYDGHDYQMACFHHQRGGSAPSYLISKDAGSSSLSAVAVAVSGVPSGHIPRVVTQLANSNVNSFTATIDTFSTDCLVIGAYGTPGGASQAADFDGTMTEVQDLGQVESGYHGPNVVGWDDPAAAGSNTYTFDGPNSQHYVGMLVAFEGTDPSDADKSYVISQSLNWNQYGDTNLVCTEPAGAAEDDVLVAFEVSGETETTITRPSGWTTLSTTTNSSDEVTILYITRGASAPNLTWTKSASDTALDVTIVACRGVTTTGIASDETTISSTTTKTTTAVDASGGGAVLGFGAHFGSAIGEAYSVASDFVPMSHTWAETGAAATGPNVVAYHNGSPTSTETFTITNNASQLMFGALVFLPAAAGGLDITPAAVTVNATPGTLTITTGAVDITPSAVTVNATPGTLALAVDVPLAGPTVNATPGGLTVTTGAVDITPAAVTVTATAGSMTVTAGAVDITPAAVVVTASPGTVALAVDIPLTGPTVTATAGSLTITTGAVDITPAAVTVTATPGDVTISQALPISPDPVTVTATPGTLTITTGAVDITPAAVTVNATPGSLSLSVDVALAGPTVTAAAGTLALAVDIPLAGSTVTATPGAVTVANAVGGTQDITPDPVTVTATTGTVTITTGAVDITPAATTVTATPGSVEIGLSAALTGATITATPGTVTITTGAVDITPDPVTVTVTAGTLSVNVGALYGFAVGYISVGNPSEAHVSVGNPTVGYLSPEHPSTAVLT